MKIQDFADMEKFESIMSDWAVATGLATVAVGADGKYISECYNFTDFCIKLTRGSKEGCRRCEKCDAEGQGVYHCHAGLVDFGIPLKLNDGTVLGSVIGGQVLPEHPNEEKFRGVARELGINEDEYIEALGKVTVRTEAEINAAANLLGAVLNNFINSEYNSKYNGQLITKLTSGGVALKDGLILGNAIGIIDFDYEPEIRECTIYPIFSNIRGWKGISIEHVEKLASDKEVDSYSKSLKIGDYL